MWRQARGAGLRGALPCGMRCGLLCAVCWAGWAWAGQGIPGTCAHHSDPPLLYPAFPSFQPLLPPSLWWGHGSSVLPWVPPE